MAKTYEPKQVEGAGWYEWYDKQGLFQANNGREGSTRNSRQTKEGWPDGGTFSLVIPPPNVTGRLHIGHALTTSIQDSIVRWRRMRGDNVLYLPGTDHAGISTQTIVEKKLLKERGLSRHDLGREKFMEEVWKWKDDHGHHIVNQLRRMGSSLDWSREAFTMDGPRSEAVSEAFVRLNEAGLVYRATRLVNWCCFLESVISDIEVDYEELTKRTYLSLPGHSQKVEFGVIHNFVYPVEGGGFIEVATTRPETMLGDTAVAVHPDDERYKEFHGRYIIHPFNQRRIPIITDSTLVDMEIGTGAVKVTPAHDPDDYACGLRNSLPQINLLTSNGTINQAGGKFQGMGRMEARRAVIDALTEAGLYRGKKEHPMKLALCSRSGDVIEPLLKPQWYVKCADMAKEASRLVREGEVEILPKMYKDDWFRWLDNPQDWCVSRQLWWGHRIPAYQVVDKSTQAQQHKGQDEEHIRWIVGRNIEEAEANAVKQYRLQAGSFTLVQDEDVLDTWFSSSLFPLSTLGWPKQTIDLSKYYPLSVMETGADILFFWVARMAMICTFLAKEAPFQKIYLHAMVRDAHGRKMSKTLGNVIDPIHVIEGRPLAFLQENLTKGNLFNEAEIKKAGEGLKADFPNGIPECGTDALRFTLVDYTLQGRNINLDINRVVANRHFCNKMWNATRFVLMYLSNEHEFNPNNVAIIPESDEIVDNWIKSRLAGVIHECDKAMQTFEPSLATSALHSFFIGDFCDVYLEYAKIFLGHEANKTYQERTKAVLHSSLDTFMKLLHPFMPFVSEELWQRLPALGEDEAKPECLMNAPYPIPSGTVQALRDQKKFEQPMQEIMSVVHAARSLTANHVTKKGEIKFIVNTRDQELLELFSRNSYLIKHLSRSAQVIVQQGDEPKGCGVRIVDHKTQVYLPLESVTHEQIKKEIEKLNKKQNKMKKDIESILQARAAPLYTERVPHAVQEKDREVLEGLQKELLDVERSIVSITSLIQ